MAPSTPKYESVPRTDTDLDVPASVSGSDDDNSGSDDDAEYTGRAKRRSLVNDERSRFDRETLGGQEEVERLLTVGAEKRRNKRAKRGELGRLEQGGKSETSSISGGDESPVRAGEVAPKVGFLGGEKAHERVGLLTFDSATDTSEEVRQIRPDICGHRSGVPCSSLRSVQCHGLPPPHQQQLHQLHAKDAQ